MHEPYKLCLSLILQTRKHFFSCKPSVCGDDKNPYLISIKVFVHWSLNPFKSEPVVYVKFNRICILYVMDLSELIIEEKQNCSENQTEVCYCSYDVCSITHLNLRFCIWEKTIICNTVIRLSLVLFYLALFTPKCDIKNVLFKGLDLEVCWG